MVLAVRWYMRTLSYRGLEEVAPSAAYRVGRRGLQIASSIVIGEMPDLGVVSAEPIAVSNVMSLREYQSHQAWWGALLLRLWVTRTAGEGGAVDQNDDRSAPDGDDDENTVVVIPVLLPEGRIGVRVLDGPRHR